MTEVKTDVPTMSDQRFIDNIVDRVRDLLPSQPVIVPGEPPKADTPMTWFRWAVLVALAVFASWRGGWKEPITVPAPPIVQSQPAVVVLQVPAGAVVANAEAKKASVP